MKSGYEVTFDDFLRLVSDPYCLPDVRPLIKKWFNAEIVEQGKEITVIQDASGNPLSKARLHLAIQADPDMQGSLYRTSQTLWR